MEKSDFLLHLIRLLSNNKTDSEKYPDLVQLFGGYFNQDFDVMDTYDEDDGKMYKNVINEFYESKDQSGKIINQINELLNDSNELSSRRMASMEMYFVPKKQTMEEFLNNIRDLFIEKIKSNSKIL